MSSKRIRSPKDLVIPERPNITVQSAAEEFHDAALALREAQRGTGNKHFYNFVVCSTVNAAFALELYLKTLNTDRVVLDEPIEIDDGVKITEHDVPRKYGHRLSNLFRALDIDVQNHLETEYSRAPISRECATLQSALTVYDETFEKWRYLFETLDSDSPDSAALFELLEFFRGAMKTVPPA